MLECIIKIRLLNKMFLNTRGDAELHTIGIQKFANDKKEKKLQLRSFSQENTCVGHSLFFLSAVWTAMQLWLS